MGEALIGIGGAFLAAGFFARFGRRLGLPTIPFFMVAGILFGPNTPGLVVLEHPEELELLASLGLVLLLFHLGLEFSLGDLVAGGKGLLAAGAAYLALNVGGGLAFGFALGWGSSEALVIAGAIGISSSAIVTKLLVELRRLANPESRLILGIVVVEDVFLALYLAMLSPVLGNADSAGEAILDFLIALAFLLGLAAVSRWGSSVVGKVLATPDDELLTVCFVGLAVLIAGVAEELGVSDAIGAFMVGTVIAGTVVAERIERLVLPLRDTFAAAFFFAFGLTIDPGDVGEVAVPVAAAVAVSLVLNLLAGQMAARINGFDRRGALDIGLTVLGRGEFSLIIATLGVAAGLDARIGPFVALYVLVLAIAGPLLAGLSPTIGDWLDRRRPPSDDTDGGRVGVPEMPPVPTAVN
jgi:CPA2 family monovalent cation:H+ antiporter-2